MPSNLNLLAKKNRKCAKCNKFVIKAEKISAATSEFRFSYFLMDYTPTINIIYDSANPDKVSLVFINSSHTLMDISLESELEIVGEKNFNLISLDLKKANKDTSNKNEYTITIENPEKKLKIPLNIKVENKFENYNASVAFDFHVILEEEEAKK